MTTADAFASLENRLLQDAERIKCDSYGSLTLMATPDATGYNNNAADANQSGAVEIGDITTILTIMAGGE
ncbi:MAG: hypothetical protein J5630_05030 [Bacteroidaceae bacterium]|nr:hypothetical protein [Bacteroidaceae bacterium]